MRAVWIYRDYHKGPARLKNKVDGNCEIFNRRELEVMSGALASWQVLAPEVERVLYLDLSIYNYLSKVDMLKRYDKVILVDFNEVLDSKYPNNCFFASPKLWALTQCNEPTILLDTETVLFQPLKDWMNPENFYAFRYSVENPIHPSKWHKNDIEGYNVELEKLGELGRFVNYQDMIEAGITYWPDPKAARWVGNKALEVCEKVCSTNYLAFDYKWTMCEESNLIPILRDYVSNNYEEGRAPEICVLPSQLDVQCPVAVEISGPGWSREVYSGFAGWMHTLCPEVLKKIQEIDPYYTDWDTQASVGYQNIV